MSGWLVKRLLKQDGEHPPWPMVDYNVQKLRMLSAYCTKKVIILTLVN